MVLFVISILPIKELLQGLVIIVHGDIQTLEIIVPLGYVVVNPIGFLFWGGPFTLSCCEGARGKQQAIHSHHAPGTVGLHRHHPMHLCILMCTQTHLE